MSYLLYSSVTFLFFNRFILCLIDMVDEQSLQSVFISPWPLCLRYQVCICYNTTLCGNSRKKVKDFKINSDWRDKFEKFQKKNQGVMMTWGEVEFGGNFGAVQRGWRKIREWCPGLAWKMAKLLVPPKQGLLICNLWHITCRIKMLNCLNCFNQCVLMPVRKT